MFWFLRVATVLLISTSVSLAQPGNLHRHDTGLGVRLPLNWSAKDGPDGVLMLPPGAQAGNQDGSEVYAVTVQTGYDSTQEGALLKKYTDGFLKPGNRILRSVEGEGLTAGSRAGKLHSWDILDPETGKPFTMRLYIVPAGNVALVLLAAGELERVRPRDPVMRQILASMNYEPPKVVSGGPLAGSSQLSQMWLTKLHGRVIKQFIGGGGAVGQKQLYLAADGSYTYRSSVAIAADVGPYGGAPTASASSTARNANAGKVAHRRTRWPGFPAAYPRRWRHPVTFALYG